MKAKCFTNHVYIYINTIRVHKWNILSALSDYGTETREEKETNLGMMYGQANSTGIDHVWHQ